MEQEGKSSTEQVAALIMFKVRPERMNDFEEWIKGINKVVKKFEGYLGADIIRPRDHAHPEYVIVLRFDQYDHLRAWVESLERVKWLKMSLLTIMALYLPFPALITVLSYFLPGWPRALIVLLTVLILVPTMTYYIMPWVTRLFRSWLYPEA